MLSNAYLLAKFRFDTAENEPGKNLQNFANFPNFANPNPLGPGDAAGRRVAAPLQRRRAARGLAERELGGAEGRRPRAAPHRGGFHRRRVRPGGLPLPPAGRRSRALQRDGAGLGWIAHSEFDRIFI